MIESDIQLREHVAHLNDLALGATLKEFNITLPTRNAWRACRRTTGTLSGLEHLGTLTVLATDGMLGLFLNPEGSIHLLHKDYFSGEVRPAHSVPKATSNESKARRGATTSQKAKRKALLALL